MKKVVAALTVLSALVAIPAMASSTTLTGVVTDDMCGLKHMMPGKSDADCTRDCVKHGAHYALSVNDKVYVLSGNTAAIDKLAGAKATVVGELKGNTLTVQAIVAAK